MDAGPSTSTYSVLGALLVDTKIQYVYVASASNP
jgi:hypothetical protein